MAIWTPAELHFLETVAKLAYTNPFYTERIALEKAALGKEFRPDGLVWSSSPSDPEAVNPNAWKIADRIEPLLMKARERLGEASNKESTLYEEGVHHLLYQRYYPEFISVSRKGWAFYKKLLADWEFFFHIGRKEFETQWQPEHLFACYWQVARAFHHIFDSIVGNSLQVARLRASVWESIFTYDARRYRRSLYLKMAEFPTLITGPSGSGKEIVARAIAGSRYVPFHAGRMMFEEPKEGIFAAINMAALSPALIESELFGHRRGAFTGAVGDRKGYLESCPAVGSVFLDELGELDMNLQAKLLRVLETRSFQPVGDVVARKFEGKLIAATNRDLGLEIGRGRFREDLYYRLCADRIEAPGLAEQLRDRPETMRELVMFMARRAAGSEAAVLSEEVMAWMERELPAGYRWPGNYRELEQCVRNILIRRSYRPLVAERAGDEEDFYRRMKRGEARAAEVLGFYSAMVYGQCGSYEETARRIGLDRRTVKARVDEWLRVATVVG